MKYILIMVAFLFCNTALAKEYGGISFGVSEDNGISMGIHAYNVTSDHWGGNVYFSVDDTELNFGGMIGRTFFSRFTPMIGINAGVEDLSGNYSGGRCQYTWQTARDGSRCGKRAASYRSGGDEPSPERTFVSISYGINVKLTDTLFIDATHIHGSTYVSLGFNF